MNHILKYQNLKLLEENLSVLKFDRVFLCAIENYKRKVSKLDLMKVKNRDE